MERVSQVYGLGDVCVVSCKPGLGGAAMPSKMLSIMSAGRAVVASFDKGELTYILENHKCGMYAPAGDVEAFAEMIKHLSQNRDECKAMGDNARKLILQKFTKAYGTSRYVEIIKSLTNKNKETILSQSIAPFEVRMKEMRALLARFTTPSFLFIRVQMLWLLLSVKRHREGCRISVVN